MDLYLRGQNLKPHTQSHVINHNVVSRQSKEIEQHLKVRSVTKQTPTRLITTMSIFHNITTTLRPVKTVKSVLSDLDQNWVDQQPLPCLSPLSLWCCSFDSELEPTISSDSSMHQGLGTTSFVIHVEKNKKTIVSHKLEV